METKQLLVGGRGVEFQHFANRVIQGLQFADGTTGSSQATGASGAYAVRVDIAWGMLAVGSVVKEEVARADVAVDSGSGVLASGEARYYDFVYYRSRGNGTVYFKIVKGAVAVSASAVPPTDAEVEAYFDDDTAWMRVARLKVIRSGDTALTLTFDHTVRNTLVPGTVHYGENPLP